ncbi:MAG: hypothetical protein JO313_11500 [Verrucomicrobia bacterium]|nr:hypothetical protein [Verrucomicrobiota bacterium]
MAKRKKTLETSIFSATSQSVVAEKYCDAIRKPYRTWRTTFIGYMISLFKTVNEGLFFLKLIFSPGSNPVTHFAAI